MHFWLMPEKTMSLERALSDFPGVYGARDHAERPQNRRIGWGGARLAARVGPFREKRAPPNSFTPGQFGQKNGRGEPEGSPRGEGRRRSRSSRQNRRGKASDASWPASVTGGTIRRRPTCCGEGRIRGRAWLIVGRRGHDAERPLAFSGVRGP